jgi:non-specific serine/threonine protein kinase
LLTTFIGREAEVAEVADLLSRYRLVTLTGTGGVGKTRLALQACAEVFEHFADGAYLVELAALTDPELVTQAVASVLGVREEPGRELIDILSGFLSSRHVFLLLDNCEHLIGGCAKLAERLLLAAPGLRVLATGREPLGVSGEATYRVPSLAAPPADSPPESISRSEAVQLFADRATLANRRFSLTDRNAAPVADICLRLDGIPLAIELAAARTNVLSPNQIAERLHDRFSLLTSGPRTAPTRQQTLRATIDWSYELLGEPEQTLLQYLTVFAGGFTLEAAEAVCAVGLEDFQILDLVSALVDKSLVVVGEQPERPRYWLLESVRQYAAEKLDAAREPALRSAHVKWFLTLAERAHPENSGLEHGSWLDRLEADHGNLRLALATSADGSDDDRLKLARALWHFWYIRGHWTEGRRWLDAVIANAPDGSSRARAMSSMAVLAGRQGEQALAQDWLERALAIFREIGDLAGVAGCLTNLGRAALGEGNYQGGRASLEEALAISHQIGDSARVARCLSNLAIVAAVEGDKAGAAALHEEALTTFREIGDRDGVRSCLNNLGTVALGDGDYPRARTFFEESLAMLREIGDRSGGATCLMNLGVVAHSQGDYGVAVAYYEEALATFREIGDSARAASCLANLGTVAQTERDYRGARGFLEQAVATFREIGDRGSVAICLKALGSLSRVEGSPGVARGRLREALSMSRDLALKSNAIDCIEAIAGLACEGGDGGFRGSPVWRGRGPTRDGVSTSF